MTTRDLIFSNKPSIRIKRHVLFWVVMWLYYAFLHAAQPFGKDEISYFQNLPFTLSESILLFIPQFLMVYPLLYFVLPRFIIRERYLAAIGWILFFNLVVALVYTIMMRYTNRQILSAILPAKYMTNTERPVQARFMMALIGSFKGSSFYSSVAVGIKLVKHFYIKEQRNLKLQKENSEAQLQLLTAQVHPHFLFNTLNNIYSKAQNESPGSAKMIMELSHLLRFVMDEGNKILVPLETELQMITDYINLEKTRYDASLELHISMPAKTEELFIAPLILLPFIENAFKHGASKIIHHPWINLKIWMHDTTLNMKLMNGKTQQQTTPMQQQRTGIGLENVKKRLELLYEGKHDMHINEDEEVFIVNLAMGLVKENDDKPATVPSNQIVYA